MAETEAAAATPATKKSKAASKPRKPKTQQTHPKVSEMVNTAIGELKEKGGSSLQAIKKYISGHYKVDMERLTPFIRKYLKNAVASGALQQTKGKGASGSFKISGGKTEKPKKPVAVKAKKPKTPLKKVSAKKVAPKKPAAKKAKKPKTPVKKTKATKPKAVKAKKPKSPAKKASKAKK